MSGSFWAFIGISIVVIVTPGPDTALTIRNTLLGGRSGGIFTGLGVATGQAIWALATSLGVVALLVASEPVFAAIKLAGAGYLIFLGVQGLYTALRSSTTGAPDALSAPCPRLRASSAFGQGVLSDLGNPKMAVFFTSLLPQFASRGEGMFLDLVNLGLIFCAMTFLWLTVYAVGIAMAGDFLRRPRIRRAVEGVTGAVLIALGLRLATEQR